MIHEILEFCSKQKDPQETLIAVIVMGSIFIGGAVVLSLLALAKVVRAARGRG